MTDGALPADQDGAALDRALGALPGLELSVAAFVVRPPDDDPVGRDARQALQRLRGARGGIARELRTGEIGEAVTGALADLDRGGDVARSARAVDGRAVHAGGRRWRPARRRRA